jgi:hypothetical protein
MLILLFILFKAKLNYLIFNLITSYHLIMNHIRFTHFVHQPIIVDNKDKYIKYKY